MKKSKILSILLAIMMIVSTMSCLTVISNAAIVAEDGVKAEDGVTVIEPYWQLDDNGVLTIFMECEATWEPYMLDIKRVVYDTSVSRIPNSAFVGYLNLTEVEVFGSVGVIEAGAFQNLDALKSVAIGSVHNIEDYAFYDCDNLEQVYIGGGLVGSGEQTFASETPLGKNIFKSCDKLSYVWLGNGCLSIGYGMFEDCVSLAEIDMPDSIVDIGKLAFENCASLTEIVIPDSVESVGDYAYYDCVSAKSLYIGHEAEYFGEFVFGNNTSLVDVEIKCAMPVISYGMFYGCSSLKSLDNLPQGVRTIGAAAFMGCTSLEAITIPTTTTMIGESAFDGTALVTIDIPWNVSDIGAGAFTNCAELTEINVDAKNQTYASVDGALYDITLDTLLCCPAGKTGTYTIHDGTTTLANDAFIGCDGLDLIEAPDSIDTIASNAFNGCTATIATGCTSALAKFAEKRGLATELVHSSETQWVEISAPTCTVDGEKAEVCADCSVYVLGTDVIPAIGHNYDNGVVTKKATCDEDGVVTFTCANCGDSYTETIPATNHKYDNGVDVLNPTCENTGIKRFTCQNDGCYDYYDIDIPATGHNYTSTVTKAATCEDDGILTTSCDRCGDYTTEAIPATGHAYDAGVVTTAATCDEDGVMTYTCANCGDSYTEAIPAIGHNYVEAITKPATCLEEGKKTHTCSNCGDAYETTFAGEHNTTIATVNPTCDETGKTGEWCVICSTFVGAVTETPAKGHSYKDGKCTACGKADGTTAPQPAGRPATPKMKLIRNEVKGLSVTWAAVDGAKSYRVYRRGAGDKYWTYITTVTGTSYLDTKATTGNYWRYTVRAVGQTGLYSGYENGIYIKRVDTPAMKKLTNTANGINVEWSSVSNAKEYRVYRRGAGETTWTYIATVTGTSYLDAAVKNANGQYFRYTVRAVDGYYSNFESGIYTKRVTK